MVSRGPFSLPERLCASVLQVKQVLSRTGQLFMVTVADNKPAEIIAVLEEWGLTGVTGLLRLHYHLSGRIRSREKLYPCVC